MNYKYYDVKLINAYNNAYFSYLSGTDPSVFLHILLNKIINIINAKWGVMMKYNNDTHKFSLITHTSNKIGNHVSSADIYFSNFRNIRDDWYTFSKIINRENNIDQHSLLMQTMQHKQVVIIDNCHMEELFGTSIDSSMFAHEQQNGSLVLVPFIFDNQENGIMLVCNDEYYNDKIKNIFRPFCNMMGLLIHNISLSSDFHNCIDPSMTYQIALDILNVVDDNIVVTDRDMKIIYNNDCFANMIKYHYHQDIPEYLIDILPQTVSIISNGTDNNFYRNKKIRANIKNTNSYINIIVNSITTCGGIYHVLKLCDNKETKIIKKHDSKNLVAYLSHELRNPIQVIGTGIYIINRLVNKIDEYAHLNNNNKSTYDPETDKSKQSDSSDSDSRTSYSGDSIDNLCVDTDEIKMLKSVVKRVNCSCKNMNIIINDVIDLSKIDNDELIMNFDKHRLQDITDTIFDEIKDEVKKNHLNIEYEFDDICPEYIYTDDTRVFQIITNLINNSIKYSYTGTIKFKITYDETINSVHFQISDEGKGIRKEELDNLFKKYGRTSNNTHDVNTSGLGLYVCQKIANLLGGSIEVQSEYKKGSTFTFIHPIKLGYSTSEQNIEPLIYTEVKGNILIVDDDHNITSLFKLLLRCISYDHGYDLNIETASTCDKALLLSKQQRYDLIFLDIDLYSDDECTVRENLLYTISNYDVPIIAITANIKSKQSNRDVKYNVFDDIILKPFSNKDIEKIVIKYLAK